MKRKDGHTLTKGATLKVVDLEDHTERFRRVAACSWVMLYIRKEMGILFAFFAPSLGVGADTLTFSAFTISATAVSILVQKFSWDSWLLTSLSKGIAMSLPPGRLSHVFSSAISMCSKTAVGQWSCISGMGPGEYLSVGLRISVFPLAVLSFSTSSMRADTADDGSKVWVWLSGWGVSPGPSLVGVFCGVLMASVPHVVVVGFAVGLCLVGCSVVHSISGGGGRGFWGVVNVALGNCGADRGVFPLRVDGLAPMGVSSWSSWWGDVLVGSLCVGGGVRGPDARGRGSSGKGDGRGMVGSMSMASVSLGSSAWGGSFFFVFSFLSFLFFRASAEFAAGPLDSVVLAAVEDFILDGVSGRGSWVCVVGDGVGCSMGVITLCGFGVCILVLCYRPSGVSCFTISPCVLGCAGLWR